MKKKPKKIKITEIKQKTKIIREIEKENPSQSLESQIHQSESGNFLEFVSSGRAIVPVIRTGQEGFTRPQNIEISHQDKNLLEDAQAPYAGKQEQEQRKYETGAASQSSFSESTIRVNAQPPSTHFAPSLQRNDFIANKINVEQIEREEKNYEPAEEKTNPRVQRRHSRTHETI